MQGSHAGICHQIIILREIMSRAQHLSFYTSGFLSPHPVLDTEVLQILTFTAKAILQIFIMQSDMKTSSTFKEHDPWKERPLSSIRWTSTQSSDRLSR